MSRRWRSASSDTPDHNGASENACGDPDGDGSEGDCFLTTAISEQRGEADDGPTLTALRHFRDHYMTVSPEHREMVASTTDWPP